MRDALLRGGEIALLGAAMPGRRRHAAAPPWPRPRRPVRPVRAGEQAPAAGTRSRQEDIEAAGRGGSAASKRIEPAPEA